MKNCSFLLNHAIWDSYGHLGGRPRCITARCRGLRSPAFLGQFCPTISIKLSTAKARQLLKCGGIRAARITRSWDTPEHLPCECHASPYAGYRPTKTPLSIISGEVRRSKNPWRANTTRKFNCTVANRGGVCTGRNSADTLTQATKASPWAIRFNTTWHYVAMVRTSDLFSFLFL